VSSEAAPQPAALERLELRSERLGLTFRFTYAFHAREVRFERDAGSGFERIFPETFSFHPDRHDPAEVYIQLDDLARKPRLLAPRAARRDAEILISRLILGVPRYLEHLLDRLESEGRLDPRTLTRVYADVALLAQIVLRFVTNRGGDEGPGIRVAGFHLRKLVLRSLWALTQRRVDSAYLDAYVAGTVHPVNATDDLSEAGFFHTMESGGPEAVNRSLLRLCERAFYRWLEDVCLDEANRAFELADSPFESRELEVRHAISRDGKGAVHRERDLVPFLRRPNNRDCERVLGKLEAWFLRQYDIHDAAVVIHHADNLSRGVHDPDRVLSRHSSRNYVLVIALMASPFLGAAFFYDRAPALFDLACSFEIAMAFAATMWFLAWRFLWKKNLTFFRTSVPRIAAGIIVGYLPIFFIDEVWSLANQSWVRIGAVSALLASTTLLYLYIEVQRRLRDPTESFSRARQIFLLGVLQAFGIGLVITGLLGGFMATRNWTGADQPVPIGGLREALPPLVGELPKIVGMDPLYAFPSAVLLMTFLSFFIGTFLQLMWEDLPITEPL
jgi:hypothetical protein